jgi:hypothetical protein
MQVFLRAVPPLVSPIIPLLFATPDDDEDWMEDPENWDKPWDEDEEEEDEWGDEDDEEDAFDDENYDDEEE